MQQFMAVQSVGERLVEMDFLLAYTGVLGNLRDGPGDDRLQQ